MLTILRIGSWLVSLYSVLQIADLAADVLNKVLDLFDRICAYFKPDREVVVYGQ